MEPTSPISDLHLPDDLLVLKRIIAELLQTNQKQQRENEQLRPRLDLLLKRLYGPRSEPITGPTLFDGFEPPEEPTPPPEPTPEPSSAKPKRPGHGRQKLSKALPRQRIDHDLSEAEKLCPCCQTLHIQIGEEVSEQVDYHLRFARVKGCFWESSCDSVVQVRWQIPEGEEAFLHPGQGRE